MRLICIRVENVPASYLMYEGMQLTFRAANDNLNLVWTIHGNCILQSLILDERESDDTCIGDIWQFNFKPIGLIVTPPNVNIHNCGPICEDLYQIIVMSLLQRTNQEFLIYLYTKTYLRIFQRRSIYDDTDFV